MGLNTLSRSITAPALIGSSSIPLFSRCGTKEPKFSSGPAGVSSVRQFRGLMDHLSFSRRWEEQQIHHPDAGRQHWTDRRGQLKPRGLFRRPYQLHPGYGSDLTKIQSEKSGIFWFEIREKTSWFKRCNRNDEYSCFRILHNRVQMTCNHA